MKSNQNKIYIILMVCIVVLAGVCFWAIFLRNKQLCVAAAPDNSSRVVGITDVFYGLFSSKVYKETGTVKAPGQRFTVQVKQDPTYFQIGNAQGVVTVNDPKNEYQFTTGPFAPSYVFYTSYDSKNEWYTIITAKAVGGLQSGGDQ